MYIICIVCVGTFVGWMVELAEIASLFVSVNGGECRNIIYIYVYMEHTEWESPGNPLSKSGVHQTPQVCLSENWTFQNPTHCIHHILLLPASLGRPPLSMKNNVQNRRQ